MVYSHDNYRVLKHFLGYVAVVLETRFVRLVYNTETVFGDFIRITAISESRSRV